MRSVPTDNLSSKSESKLWPSVMSSFVCNPPGNSMASTLFPNHTVQRHIEPKCSNKSCAAKCAKIWYIYIFMTLIWLLPPQINCQQELTSCISRTYAADFHQLYNSDVVLVCNPPGISMASTLFPNYTLQRHTVPKCSNKSSAAKCAKIGYIYIPSHDSSDSCHLNNPVGCRHFKDVAAVGERRIECGR